MKIISLLKSMVTPLARTTPHDAGPRLRAGDSILVDVREPHETASGVIESAIILPLNDLNGARRAWSPFLKELRNRELVLYCASGVRSCVAGRILASEGFRVLNGGCLTDWAAAGWPVVSPKHNKGSR